MKISATVHRKTRDLVRDAAEDLLAARTDSLVAIDRAEVWRFDVEGGAEARTAVRRILDETTLVVNPNIHRYTLEEGGQEEGPRCRLVVTVRDRVDAKSAAVLRSVRERLGLREISGIERSVRWALELDADEAAAAELGREIAGGGERGAGILANSHAQDADVRVIGR